MSETLEDYFDIAIVGGGMVGTTMARLLCDSPYSIALFDPIDLTSQESGFELHKERFDPRVSALSFATKKLFKQLGIWEAIEAQRFCHYENMHVWDSNGTGSISFSATDLDQAELGTIVENSVISTALCLDILEQKNLHLYTPMQIETLSKCEGGTELTAKNGVKIRAKLVIAADGANSKIRELSKFITREWEYNHHAIVTTVRTELPHQRTALQRFIETGPLAFLPLAQESNNEGGGYCSIVWSAIPQRAEQLMLMDDKNFCNELKLCIEGRLGDIKWCDKRYSFPLRQRHATSYVKDNIVLVGDAAHSIHPLAGQGVNLGFLDVEVLAKELLHGHAVARHVADPAVLGRYQRKRIGHNLGMMWLMEGFKYIFAEQSLPVRWLRNTGMNGIDEVSLVKNYFVRRAMGLDR